MNEGIRSFYRGYSASLILCSLGVVHMVSYEMLKRMLTNVSWMDAKIKDFISGSGGRFVASTIFYPLVLVRSRIQKKQYLLKNGSHGKLCLETDIIYKRLYESFKITYKREGLHGFYKGYLTNIIKTVPQQGVFFVGFGAAMRFLNTLTNHNKSDLFN